MKQAITCLAFVFIALATNAQTVSMQGGIRKYNGDYLPAFGVSYHQPVYNIFGLSVGLDGYQYNHRPEDDCGSGPLVIAATDRVLRIPVNLTFDVFSPERKTTVRVSVGSDWYNLFTEETMDYGDRIVVLTSHRNRIGSINTGIEAAYRLYNQFSIGGGAVLETPNADTRNNFHTSVFMKAGFRLYRTE